MSNLARVRLSIVALSVGAFLVFGWDNIGSTFTHGSRYFAALHSVPSDDAGAISLLTKSLPSDQVSEFGIANDGVITAAKVAAYIAAHRAASHEEALALAQRDRQSASAEFRRYALQLARLGAGVLALAVAAAILAPLALRNQNDA